MKIFNIIQNLIEIIIVLFVILYAQYISSWFTLNFQINSLNINLLYLAFILLVLAIVIAFLKHKKNRKVVYFTFIFWFFTLFTIISFYLGSMNAFLFSIADIQDFLLKNKFFSLQINYSHNYKLNFCIQYLETVLVKQNLTIEKQKFIIQIVKGSINESILNLSLADIRNYMPFLITLAETISENPELLLFGEKFVLYSSSFYGIIQFLKVLIFVLCISKIAFEVLPVFLLTKIFPQKAFLIVQTVLLNTPGVDFQMTQEEFLDLTIQLSEILLKRETALNLLLMDLDNLPYLQ